MVFDIILFVLVYHTQTIDVYDGVITRIDACPAEKEGTGLLESYPRGKVHPPPC